MRRTKDSRDVGDAGDKADLVPQLCLLRRQLAVEDLLDDGHRLRRGTDHRSRRGTTLQTRNLPHTRHVIGG